MAALEVEMFMMPASDEGRAAVRRCLQRLQDREFDALHEADPAGELADAGDLDELLPDGSVTWYETADYTYLGVETDPSLEVAPLAAFFSSVGAGDIEGRMWLPEDEAYQFFDQDAVYEAYGDREWTIMVRPISLMSETIAFTGDVSEDTRNELEALAADDQDLTLDDDGTDAEFAIQPAPTEETTLIVTGDNADPDHLEHGDRPGVRVIDETELRALMEAH